MASIFDIIEPVKHVVGQKRILDHLYGPQAKSTRTIMARVMFHDPKIQASHKEVQWGNFRRKLLEVTGVTGTCIADEDSKFEAHLKGIYAGEIET